MKFSIAVLPGDGIGPEVIGEAVKVMEAVGRRFGHQFDTEEGRVGGNAIDEFGTPLPEATEALISDTDAVLFGAVGGPKWDDPRATTRPEDGILAMRKMLGLYGNVRPVKVYPQLINSSPVKPEILKGVDMIILRELTGGLYFAKPKRRWDTSRGRRGVDTLKYTEQEIERIVRMAFEMAMGRRKRVTSVDKANVLETGRLWREIATEVGQDFPEVELEHVLVDAAAMQLIKNPAHYDVIVAENTFGDILTDEASVLSGSMGMLPSASMAGLPKKGRRGKRAISLYEPIHGSAPDIAGQGIANPIGTILSMAMLLRYSLTLEEEAVAVERSVEGALAEGYRTPDIAGDGGEVVKTPEMGDIIAGGI
ncbi:MAG: 3-isopropylmalate dehydrogenase [Chloroflexi bacterium]|nr:3-isopropylmalate dehydrogenase [Chloroflexota bacterium]MCI0791237.1 3-isopropylmalate dehydrogenase [Chloroflexota bacterium]MCI0796234.1 3-isopropylmalate dehydrogenase [Chloroflexota bacterium]MCI0841664.1 3-isopropylmalate dehydrogenase [Chloroflexota bacterium]MCI0869701.1 3-isopropylmalate dehydrogenase [Chloroflexota bacterium]